MPEKSPHERFEELGQKLLAVPKASIEAQEQQWQTARKALRKKAGRKRKK